MEKWLTRAVVLLLPFVFWSSGEQFREPKAVTLIVMAALWLFFALSEKINLALGFSFFYLVVSGAFLGRVIPYGDILALFAAAISCLWITKDNPKVVFKLLEFVGVICAVYGLAQYFGFDPIMNFQEWADVRPVALFGQHTLYGPFAVSAFAVSLFYRHWIRAAFLIVPVVLIDSSFTFLSLASVLAVWAIANFKKEVILWSIFGLFVAGLSGAIMFDGILKTEALNDKGRFALWGQVTELAANRPVLGYGLGSFKEIYPVFQNKALRVKNGISDDSLSTDAREFIRKAEQIRNEQGTFLSAHNEFLQVFFELGLLGVVCVLWILGSFFLSFRASLKNTEAWICLSIFCLFLANSLGNFPLHLVPQALLPLWAYCFVIRMKKSKWRSYGTLAKPAL